MIMENNGIDFLLVDKICPVSDMLLDVPGCIGYLASQGLHRDNMARIGHALSVRCQF